MNKTVYFLIDCSGSMYGNRANAVNTAMERIAVEVVPEIRKQKNADLNISFMFLGFSDSFPDKVVELMPRTDLDDFNMWKRIPDSQFNGGTPTGAAIEKVIQDLQGGVHGEPDPNAVAPVIILVSDGAPNGTNPSYDEIMECAVKGGPKEIRLFRKALRVALAMDVDASGRASLQKFGKVSDRMEKAGISAYHECQNEYTKDFIEILMSVTLNASVG